MSYSPVKTRRDGKQYVPKREERRIKRSARRAGLMDMTYIAYEEGENAAWHPALRKRNPYPPGRRHDEWERGFRLADPMGDHHGRNE